MKRLFLTKSKIQKLQEIIGWLDNYKLPSDEINYVKNDLNEGEDFELSKALEELGTLNIRREELINKFK